MRDRQYPSHRSRHQMVGPWLRLRLTRFLNKSLLPSIARERRGVVVVVVRDGQRCHEHPLTDVQRSAVVRRR